MFDKIIFEQVLSRIPIGAIKVVYPDKTEKIFGKGDLYTTLTINDPKAISEIVHKLDLGFGEAYTEGRVSIPDNELVRFVDLSNENMDLFIGKFGKKMNYKFNVNAKKNQKQQIQSHYDLGNDFYKLWLDDTMTYTCAYFKTPQDTLEEAQRQKIDHVLKKLQLKKGQEFVDIGCGWGYLVVKAAKEYKARGLGVTLSKEQYEFAKDLAKKEGVEDLVEFRNINYQDLLSSSKKYDRVISVGIFEHIGKGNHREYFSVVDKLLNPGGISVLHTISQQTEADTPAWIDKYVFPGGYIPSLREIIMLFPDYRMRVIDFENLRPHYALTLREWLKRFEIHVPQITKMYDENFIRMWRLYLAGSISSFETGNNQLSQIIFTKGINNDIPLTREYMN